MEVIGDLNKSHEDIGIRKDGRRGVEMMSIDSSLEEFNAEESKETG